MLEKNFERIVREMLKTIPNSYWEDKSPSISVRGIPDVRGCISGLYVALELKRSISDMNKKTKTSELQKYNLMKVCEAGGFAKRVYPGNWEETFKELMEI